MNQNIYNQHTFTVTKKVTEEQIKNLQEVLKLYEKFIKTSKDEFNYIMPITLLGDIDDIANELKSMVKRQEDFLKEVLNANQKF